MRNDTVQLPTTRREFLRLSTGGIGLLAFSAYAPQFLVASTRAATPAPERDRSILVLVQLAGGNDGLNTVVPYADDRYYKLRPTLALPRKDVLTLSDTVGLHPSLGALRGLHEKGTLALVQNVGYPNPNRSHFRSMEIWETGSDSNKFLSEGWIGRYLDNACSGTPEDSDPVAIFTSNDFPQSFTNERSLPTYGVSNRNLGRTGDRQRKLLEDLAQTPAPAGNGNAEFLKQTLMDALVTENKVSDLIGRYRPEASYPGGAFAASLRNIAALIAARIPTRVYFASLGSFDTHSNQANTHANLLQQLAEGLAAFQADLEAKGLADQVLTMTFSEFGRRPMENQSKGTDHGTAAPLFVMGTRARGGIYGDVPNLGVATNADLKFSTDFRSVYATVLHRWLNANPHKVLDGEFPELGFI